MGVNKDQIQGRVKEAAGKAKEIVGKVVGNDRLEVKGIVESNVGEVQARIGDIQKNVKEAIKGT